MAYMSYCRFQNTLADLRDCLDAITDSDLSPAERRDRLKLVRVCREIIDEYESAEMEELDSCRPVKDDEEEEG
jgi:hypothetical protein